MAHRCVAVSTPFHIHSPLTGAHRQRRQRRQHRRLHVTAPPHPHSFRQTPGLFNDEEGNSHEETRTGRLVARLRDAHRGLLGHDRLIRLDLLRRRHPLPAPPARRRGDDKGQRHRGPLELRAPRHEGRGHQVRRQGRGHERQAGERRQGRNRPLPGAGRLRRDPQALHLRSAHRCLRPGREVQGPLLRGIDVADDRGQDRRRPAAGLRPAGLLLQQGRLRQARTEGAHDERRAGRGRQEGGGAGQVRPGLRARRGPQHPGGTVGRGRRPVVQR